MKPFELHRVNIALASQLRNIFIDFQFAKLGQGLPFGYRSPWTYKRLFENSAIDRIRIPTLACLA